MAVLVALCAYVEIRSFRTQTGLFCPSKLPIFPQFSHEKYVVTTIAVLLIAQVEWTAFGEQFKK